MVHKKKKSRRIQKTANNSISSFKSLGALSLSLSQRYISFLDVKTVNKGWIPFLFRTNFAKSWAHCLEWDDRIIRAKSMQIEEFSLFSSSLRKVVKKARCEKVAVGETGNAVKDGISKMSFLWLLPLSSPQRSRIWNENESGKMGRERKELSTFPSLICSKENLGNPTRHPGWDIQCLCQLVRWFHFSQSWDAKQKRKRIDHFNLKIICVCFSSNRKMNH